MSDIAVLEERAKCGKLTVSVATELFSNADPPYSYIFHNNPTLHSFSSCCCHMIYILGTDVQCLKKAAFLQYYLSVK